MNDNTSIGDRLTVLWLKMTEAKTLADVDVDVFDIIDILNMSEKIEQECQRLIGNN